MNDQRVNIESSVVDSRGPSLRTHVFAVLIFAASLVIGWMLPAFSLANTIVALKFIGIIHPTARYKSDWLLALSVNNGLWIILALLLWFWLKTQANKLARWGMLGFLSGTILATFPLCTTLVLYCIDAMA